MCNASTVTCVDTFLLFSDVLILRALYWHSRIHNHMFVVQCSLIGRLMGVCRYMYICWNMLATLLLSFCVFCIVGLVFLYYYFFGFSSHTGTEICRKKGLVEHYFCFIVVILVKWKWRICLISAYFVINRTCPNIFVLYTLFFFLFCCCCFFFSLLLYFTLSPFSFVQICTKC